MIWTMVIAITNSGGTSHGLALPSQTPHPISSSTSPKYIGLRLTRKTPSVTRYDALLGSRGLTVVPALRKRTSAATSMTIPTTATSPPNRFHGGAIHRASGHPMMQDPHEPCRNKHQD